MPPIVFIRLTIYHASAPPWTAAPPRRESRRSVSSPIEVLPEFDDAPTYLPRTGGDRYELHINGYDRSSSILIADGEGSQSEVWSVGPEKIWRSSVNVRKSLFATNEITDPFTHEIVLWRDTALTETTQE